MTVERTTIKSIFLFPFHQQETWTCRIIGNDKSIEYFEIHPRTCVITIKENKSLADDPDKTREYPVSMSKSDSIIILIYHKNAKYWDSLV